MSFSTDATAPPRPAPALTGNAADIFVRHFQFQRPKTASPLNTRCLLKRAMPSPRSSGSLRRQNLIEHSSLILVMQDNLTLEDRPRPGSNGMRPPPPRPNHGEGKAPPPYAAGTSSRGENVPPRGPPGHRPSRSQEEAMRTRRKEAGPSSGRPRPTGELDIFADPSDTSPRKSDARRARRNSESSVASRSKLLDPEEEKKRQDRRKRERRQRDRRDGKKPDRKLDVIDKLDVTSIYGYGRQ